ncbi:MAG: tetratricopeptide repeat protein [Ignavibacteriales bacterium]|nr:tetratricopeptide repeat protein [Ignavibacteriales bacterium]
MRVALLIAFGILSTATTAQNIAPDSLEPSDGAPRFETTSDGDAYNTTTDPGSASETPPEDETAFERNRRLAILFTERGNERRQAGDLEGAVAQYDRAIEYDANYGAVYWNRGIAYADMGAYQKAIVDYTSAMDFYAEDPYGLAILYMNRGINKYYLGEFEEAIEDHTKAIRTNPNYGAAYWNRGAAYGEAGLFEDAIVDFSRAIEFYSTRANELAVLYMNRGINRREAGDLDGAVKDYSRAIDLRPDYGAAYWNRGVAYGDRGEREEAIADYTRAMKHYVENDVALAALYNNRGYEKRQLKDYREAVNDFSKAISLNPDSFAAHWRRASTYGHLGQYEKSIRDYDEAIRMATSDRVLASLYLGRAYEKRFTQDYEGAMKDVVKALAFNDQMAEAYYLSGKINYENLKNRNSAIADFERAIEISQHPGTYSAFSRFYLGDGDEAVDEMQAVIDRARKAEKDEDVAYYNMACLQALMNNAHESVKFLKMALNAGYRSVNRIRDNSDFYNIHGDGEYQATIGQFERQADF